MVAPLVGAWIEIIHFLLNTQDSMSLTLWERGLKFGGAWTENHRDSSVAPLVGAWIEIRVYQEDFELSLVAPLVGAWIEIPAFC